jgi:hypothetical protein
MPEARKNASNKILVREERFGFVNPIHVDWATDMRKVSN